MAATIQPAAFGLPAAGPRSSRVIYPTSDTHVNDGAPTTNNDTATALLIGSNYGGSDGFTRYAFLTFPLSALRAMWPIGKAVLTAPVATRNDGIGGNFGCRRVLQYYDPKTITWNNRDAAHTWATSGARSIGTDVSTEQIVIANSTGSSTTAIITMPIPVSWIADAIAAGTDLQIVFYGTGDNGNDIDIGAIETATYSRRSYLTVTRA